VSCAAGPDIKEDGLVLALDGANTKSILSAVEVLVVAGGGGGGGVIGGGGGAGGFRTETAFPITPGSAITVTVGDGGSGGFSWHSGSQRGNPGTDSIFSTITATGGGGGGAHGGNDGRVNGTTGGSGGGGGSAAGSAGNTPSTTPSQGNGGGTGDGNHGGGGGGSSANGETRVSGVRGGNGGNGTSSSISGTLVTYAGGGAGGARSGSGRVGGTGGSGGGGNGGTTDLSRSSTHGGTNTGGGGGGGGHNGSGAGAVQSGSNGGSGIVIVRYPGSQRATGGTITSVAGHTIHTFTTSGTFTPNFGDMSGRGNTGTLTNGPTYSSANGGSIVFDGTNDYVSVIPINRLTTTTLDIWFNTSSVSANTGTRQYLYTQQRNPPTLASYTYQERQGIHIAGNILQFHGSIVSISTISANTWYNFVVTLDGTTPKMYLNGTQLSVTGNLSTPKSITVNQAFVGRRGDANGEDRFGGTIASVRDYNRALTAAEIQQNFNATRSRYGI
jgi:hypothetical protein